jgi:hypothetical protein
LGIASDTISKQLINNGLLVALSCSDERTMQLTGIYIALAQNLPNAIGMTYAGRLDYLASSNQLLQDRHRLSMASRAGMEHGLIQVRFANGMLFIL